MANRVTSHMQSLAAAGLVVVALALFVVALRAWVYSRSPKVLVLSFAFGLIAAKAVLLSAALFRWPDPAEQMFLPSMLFDLAVLGTLYIAVLTRSHA